MKPTVSIIIRTYNEERWIKQCLEAVYEQVYKDFEVILVDNMSTDGTLKKAQKFPIKLVTIEKYLPGASLNTGIKNSNGDILVFLSGHCIPASKEWLGQLVDNLKNEKIAGVYGRQLPMSFTSAGDRRDLLITFGLDEKIQKKDCFFHNANSAIKRSMWEKHPFCDITTNIEDRIWATEVLNDGYYLKYSPDASVYHHHGIHHGGSEQRALNTLKIIQKLTDKTDHCIPGTIDAEKLEVICLIPVKGDNLENFQKKLLEKTIHYANECKLIKKTIVLTESEKIKTFAESRGALVPFLRDHSLSKEYVDLSMLYENSIPKLEEANIHPDLIVSLEPNYLFRTKDLVETLITELLEKGYDTTIPTYEEFNAVWNAKTLERIDNGDIPRKSKSPIYITDKGLALVTYPELLRSGNLYGKSIGHIILKNNFSKIEIKSQEDLDVFENYIKYFKEENVQ